MMTSSEELRQYCARLRPIYCELFAIAHTILGNAERAEQIVQRVALAGWSGKIRTSAHLGFRDGMRAEVKRRAYAEARLLKSDLPMTWNGLLGDAGDDFAEEPFLRLAAKEDTEQRRILALRYGCGFSAVYIAKLLDMPRRDVRNWLQAFETKLRKKRKNSEAYYRRIVLSELARSDARLFGMASVYRALQAESVPRTPKHPVLGYIIRSVAGVLAVVVLGALLWLTAVLIQAPTLQGENTGSPRVVMSHPS